MQDIFPAMHRVAFDGATHIEYAEHILIGHICERFRNIVIIVEKASSDKGTAVWTNIPGKTRG